MDVKVFEVDLAGLQITQAVVDKLYAQILAAEDVGMVDIILRNVSRWGTCPQIIVDYSGEVTTALAKALNIITEVEGDEPPDNIDHTMKPPLEPKW